MKRKADLCPSCGGDNWQIDIDDQKKEVVIKCSDCGHVHSVYHAQEDIDKYNPVSAPKHYIGDGHIECKDAMRSMLAGYDRANAKSAVAYWMTTALKYIWRAPLKNGLQDLKKARECIDIAITEWGEDA